jgi:hypothetical protein
MALHFSRASPLQRRRCGEVVRAHWGVENCLHWRLDVTMNEDQARNRKDNGPENLAVRRCLAINLLSKDTSKGSTRVKMLRAAWDAARLRKLIAQI